jgi:hypothetical protein
MSRLIASASSSCLDQLSSPYIPQQPATLGGCHCCLYTCCGNLPGRSPTAYIHLLLCVVTWVITVQMYIVCVFL